MTDSTNSQLLAYKQLLNVTTNHHTTDRNDGDKFKSLDKKDQEFIENALKETIEKTDPIKVLEKTLRLIKEAKNNETKLMLIDDLIDIVGQIDLATIFVKNYQGLDEVRHNIVNEKDTEIVAAYISLLTTIAHNNIDVQNLIDQSTKEFNFLKYLLENFIQNIDAPLKLRMRSLGAISAIVGHHTNNFITFLSFEGINKLKNLLEKKTNNIELVKRTMFTLNSLKSSIPELSENYKNKYASDLLLLQEYLY